MMKICVYTALCGPKSALQPQDWLRTASGYPVDYIAFTDQANVPAPWEPRPIEKLYSDPNRNAKRYKILPHWFLPDYDVTIWIDANFRVTRGFDELLPELLTHDVVMFKHFERDCAYDEAEVCKAMGLDDPVVIDTQMRRYVERGFPRHYGLPECGTILRKKNPNGYLMNEWWMEILSFSRRDQLSFMPTVWTYHARRYVKILDRTARDGYYHQWTPHLSMSPLPIENV